MAAAIERHEAGASAASNDDGVSRGICVPHRLATPLPPPPRAAAQVEQGALTGESKPVTLRPGDIAKMGSTVLQARCCIRRSLCCGSQPKPRCTKLSLRCGGLPWRTGPESARHSKRTCLVPVFAHI